MRSNKMTTEKLIIDGVDNSAFNLEWAKRGGVFVVLYLPTMDSFYYTIVQQAVLQIKSKKTIEVWSLDTPAIEVVTDLEKHPEFIVRMATPAECEAAGIEYIARTASEQSLSDLQQRAQAALRYAEKLRGIFHVSMLKAYPQKTHQEISDEIDNAMKE